MQKKHKNHRWVAVFLFSTLCFCLPLPAPAADSPSADVLLGRMDDAEREYYTELFDYVMEHTAANQHYPWHSYHASGNFRPAKKEVRGNTVCRNYSETLTLSPTETADFDGIACKRVGDEGWCRLRVGEMRTCAMEPPRTLFQRALRDSQEALDASTTSARAAKKSIFDWWPF